MATSLKPQSGEHAIMEHDIVRLLNGISTDAGTISAGETGTVVYIHRGGQAFEVEFDVPFDVVTVTAMLVERVPV